MAEQNDERPPKPYGFVPISAPRAESTIGHDRLYMEHCYTGRVIYSIEVLTPLCVASGTYALGEDAGYPEIEVLRDCYRSRGRPAIPGSSIKGLVRNIVEAVSPSCVTVTRLDKRFVPYAKAKACSPAHACPACSMFGRLNRMSKVSFCDLLHVQGNTMLYRPPPLYRPQAHRAEFHYMKKVESKGGESKSEFKGRKFYYHSNPQPVEDQPSLVAMAPGSRLEGRLDFENLTAAEMGLLFYAMGLDGSITPKLGGGKPVGLGAFRVDRARLELWDGASFVRPQSSPQSLEQDALTDFISLRLRDAVRARLILREPCEALRVILSFPTDRDALTGMY